MKIKSFRIEDGRVLLPCACIPCGLRVSSDGAFVEALTYDNVTEHERWHAAIISRHTHVPDAPVGKFIARLDNLFLFLRRAE
jgi:hypothetical protein